MNTKRRKTKAVSVGNVLIGNGNPVVIQSMTNTPTSDIEKTSAQIRALADAGCEIIRCAVPDESALEALPAVIERSPLPVVADIHYRSDLAVSCIEAGAAKIRINPGNIGESEKLLSVITAAKAKGVPVRIGVNSGSLEKDLLEKHGHPTSDALVESMMRYVAFCEGQDFTDLVLSVKSSSVQTMIQANRMLAGQVGYPLHIGVTEAGTPEYGTLKSAVGIGSLLIDGIGDTIRVSLSGDPVAEIEAAKKILKASGVRLFGPEIITCPTCGRTQMDVSKIAREVEARTASLAIPIRIAVMGCDVNGPGEAAEADIGIACGKTNADLFVKGKKIGKVNMENAVEELLKEINSRF